MIKQSPLNNQNSTSGHSSQLKNILKTISKDSALFSGSNISKNAKIVKNLFKRLSKSKKNCQNLVNNIDSRLFQKIQLNEPKGKLEAKNFDEKKQDNKENIKIQQKNKVEESLRVSESFTDEKKEEMKFFKSEEESIELVKTQISSFLPKKEEGRDS